MPATAHEIVRLDEVDSTNSAVLKRPEFLERAGLVLLAQHQTGGRGRLGRRWVSLPGRQLQFSVVLHPRFPTADYPLVAMAAGLAVAQALQTELALPPALKWPNDVLLGGRKVCGILVEGTSGAGGQHRLVVGIGINCLGSAADFPPELRTLLTTCEEQAGRPVAGEPLLHAVLARLDAACERLERGEKPALLADWRALGLLGPGQRVRVHTPRGEREGVPEDLTPEGYLLVRLADGSAVTQVSGELEWLD
jgi:BirA family transcriptional regulator, biotin operon repressor / biotin---[acetyl-CoA-carboxylase] ligase